MDADLASGKLGKGKMVTQEIIGKTEAAQRVQVAATTPDYTRPLALVTSLFFMWGFLTCLNDILVPHLKSIFDLTYAQVMLVQFAFFSAYFLFSVPWSKVVNTIGYQRTMVVGLLTMACAAFLFGTARNDCVLPVIFDRAPCSRCRDHRSSGVCEPLCRSIGQA